MHITVQRRLFTGRVHTGVHACDHRGSWGKNSATVRLPLVIQHLFLKEFHLEQG